MDELIKQKLLNRNEKLISMVIERAKTEFPNDIALIGLTGSFQTGDFHDRSDLDLMIVNNTDRGWEISKCFILDDVGFDFYCTSWESLEKMARIESPWVSKLLESRILYCSKPEYLDRFNGLKELLIHKLAEPIGRDCVLRAKKHLCEAKQEYADMCVSNNTGAVRYAAGGVLYYLILTIATMNNTYIKYGTKKYLDEIMTYSYRPENFEQMYHSLVEAKTIEEIKKITLSSLISVTQLYNDMYQAFTERHVPTYENLGGTYEELWSNYRNKVIQSVSAGNKINTFHVAVDAQNFLDVMTENKGTKKFDLLQYYDSDNLELFKEAFIRAMDEYLEEYRKVGKTVEKFDTLEEFHNDFMKL